MSNNNGGRGQGAGSGRGGFRSGGRGNGRNGRGNNGASTKTNKPKGECPDLGSHIFTCGDDNQADVFNKTTEKVLNYIFVKFEHGKYIKESL